MRALSIVCGLGVLPFVLACVCGAGGVCGEPVCLEDRMQVVFDETLDFDARCSDLGCVGGAGGSRVDALLPNDHALAVGPNASATVTFRVTGAGDGRAAAATVRCDEGTSLRIAGRTVETSTAWRRWSAVLATPTTVLASAADLSAGGGEVSVAVQVEGPGRCMIDRVRLVTSGRFCVRFSPASAPAEDAARGDR